jgi:hypothetical protein
MVPPVGNVIWVAECIALGPEACFGRDGWSVDRRLRAFISRTLKELATKEWRLYIEQGRPANVRVFSGTLRRGTVRRRLHFFYPMDTAALSIRFCKTKVPFCCIDFHSDQTTVVAISRFLQTA